MKYIWILIVTLFFFNMPVMAKGNAAEGASKIAVCAGCHGMDGNSLVPIFPRLSGLGEKYLYMQLRHVQRGERVIASMMGILDASSDQDLWDMAAYYNCLLYTSPSPRD